MKFFDKFLQPFIILFPGLQLRVLCSHICLCLKFIPVKTSGSRQNHFRFWQQHVKIENAAAKIENAATIIGNTAAKIGNSVAKIGNTAAKKCRCQKRKYAATRIDNAHAKNVNVAARLQTFFQVWPRYIF